jgi:hypothetical protein
MISISSFKFSYSADLEQCLQGCPAVPLDNDKHRTVLPMSELLTYTASVIEIMTLYGDRGGDAQLLLRRGHPATCPHFSPT